MTEKQFEPDCNDCHINKYDYSLLNSRYEADVERNEIIEWNKDACNAQFIGLERIAEELNFKQMQLEKCRKGYEELKREKEYWKESWFEEMDCLAEHTDTILRLMDEKEILEQEKERYKRLSEIRSEEIHNRILTIKEFIDNCSDRKIKKVLNDLFYSEVNEYDLSKENRKLHKECEELLKENGLLRETLDEFRDIDKERDVEVEHINNIYNEFGFDGIIDYAKDKLASYGAVREVDTGLWLMATGGWSDNEFWLDCLQHWNFIYGKGHYRAITSGGGYYYSKERYADIMIKLENKKEVSE